MVRLARLGRAYLRKNRKIQAKVTVFRKKNYLAGVPLALFSVDVESGAPRTRFLAKKSEHRTRVTVYLILCKVSRLFGENAYGWRTFGAF